MLPLYENTDPKYRINKNDAIFVDIIHTNGNSLGLFNPLGHIDFYPSGGKSQLNCKVLDKGMLLLFKLKLLNSSVQ